MKIEDRKPRTGNEKWYSLACFPIPVFQFLLCILLSGAAVAAEPAATPARQAPEGYGKAKFGMPLEQVRQLYPALAPAPAVTAAAYFRSPNLKRFWLAGVTVRGLKSPCDLELRFWKNQLWSVITFYGANPFPDVVQNLEREYGPPTIKSSDPTWVFGTATLITSPGQQWYSVDGAEVGKDVQREFMEAVRQHEAKKAAQTPTAQAPPGQAPAGQAPQGQAPPGQAPAGQGAPATPAP
jgi:hypothetical protein